MKTLNELYFDTFDLAFEWMLSDGGDGWATIASTYMSLTELQSIFEEWNVNRDNKLIVTTETIDRITYGFSKFDQESIVITTQIKIERGTYQCII